MLLPEDRAAKIAPEELRRRQRAAMTAWILAAARTQAVVLAFEDLHWADPTSLASALTFLHGLDPERPFAVDPMNGRYAPDFGRRRNATVAPGVGAPVESIAVQRRHQPANPRRLLRRSLSWLPRSTGSPPDAAPGSSGSRASPIRRQGRKGFRRRPARAKSTAAATRCRRSHGTAARR